ncbi:MAG: hypothetical protein ACLPXT_02205 [Terracidiphilus sp.]
MSNVHRARHKKLFAFWGIKLDTDESVFIPRFKCLLQRDERQPYFDWPKYRWLVQQGEAFGAPGMEPRWTSSVKDAVGTAYSASSRVWFTASHGILNEIYHPTIDRAQMRDMEFLVSDGETFVHEEKRDLLSSFEYIHPEALGVRYVNRDPEGLKTGP